MTADADELGFGSWVREPLSDLSPDIEPFWNGLAEHQFLLCRCKLCGSCYWPFTLCVNHAAIPEFSDMEWSPTSGEGTIFAELVVENVMDPAYRAEVPYVLVLVETDEGPLIPSRLVGADVREDHIGHRARVRYLDVPESGVTFPLFELS